MPRKPYKLDPSEGGRASAAARKLKRDAQVRRVVQVTRKLPISGT